MAVWFKCGVILTFVTCSGCAADKRNVVSSPADLANIYTLDVDLDPKSAFLDVSGTIEIVADGPTSEAAFLLNGGLDVAQFEPDMAATTTTEHGVALESFAMPNTQEITLRFDEPLVRGDRVTIDVAYSGTIRPETIEFGGGLVSEDWVELSLGSLWYPSWEGEWLIRPRISLTIPDEYDVIGPGQAVREADGTWTLDPGEPVTGRVTFAASPAWEVASREVGKDMTASLYTAVPEPCAKALLASLDGAYEQYVSMLGPPRSQRSDIKVLYANADLGVVQPAAAFSTGGDYIVLGEAEPDRQEYILAHEMAHLWWITGQVGTPDEFMIESVAEYLALRRGHAVWGDDWIAEKLTLATKVSDSVDERLMDVTGYTSSRDRLLYFRGPLVLWRLHERIGEDATDAFLAEAYEEEVSELQVFLALLEEREGADVAGWFAGQL